MFKSLPASAVVLIMPLMTTAAWGQLAVSARSGMVNHLEGQVTLADAPLKLRFGQFPEVAPGLSLAAEDGRAEVLLNPGVFLRLDDHSSFKMISNKLTDSRVEITKGAALVEVQELLKDNNVVILAGTSKVTLLKPGLYRFDAEPARLRVYDGKAQVEAGSGFVTVTKGRESALGGVPATFKFNLKDRDELYTWTQYRAQLVAQANIVSARTSTAQGYQMGSSSWAYSPYWGLYTFLPRTGIGYSPFGMYVYSPYTVWQYYAPRQTYNSGYDASSSRGYTGFGSSSNGSAAAASSVSSGSMVRAGGGASAPASAPVAAPSGARGR